MPVMGVMGNAKRAREGRFLTSTPHLPSTRKAQPSRALTSVPITSVTAITRLLAVDKSPARVRLVHNGGRCSACGVSRVGVGE